jgi:hypothetical protein
MKRKKEMYKKSCSLRGLQLFVIWSVNTAVAFRARLRFPRVTREPPRRIRSCGIEKRRGFAQRRVA